MVPLVQLDFLGPGGSLVSVTHWQRETQRKCELEDSLASILRPPEDQLVLSPEDPETQDAGRVSTGSE